MREIGLFIGNAQLLEAPIRKIEGAGKGACERRNGTVPRERFLDPVDPGKFYEGDRNRSDYTGSVNGASTPFVA